MNQEVNNDVHSLSHTKWNCKYHIVFAPKYRRKVFYGTKRLEIGQMLRQLCNLEQSKFVRGRSMSQSYSYSCGNTAETLHFLIHGIPERKEQHDDIRKVGDLKMKYRNREFWCRGYYVDTAGKNAKNIETYIRNQLEEDRLSDQMSFGDYDPLTGSK